jgi:two-component system, NtrC family, response regulator HydG
MTPMKAKDLYLKDLLETEPESGIIRLVNQRVLLFDAIALGLLQKELIDSMGIQVARTVFSRFGYAHGWRTAESLKEDWADLMHEDSFMGPRLHTLYGQLTNLSLTRETDEDGYLVIKSTWKDSYEAEQYLLHHSVPDKPVCWTMAAFASGYVSNRTGQDFYFIEVDCVAKGDELCTLVGRPKHRWGKEYAEYFNYFGPEAIDALLPELNLQLKNLEKQLSVKRRQIAMAEDEVLYDKLSARSEAMRRTIDLAKRISRVDSTIVISGESGVGKEKLARLIHDNSTRASHPFIAVNCGAFSESLLESELFGYVKGAFTDAVSDRLGLFESANGGTLFLDEVGDLPYPMQVKLLRALQEREIRRIGDSKARPIDVRILSATNKDLAKEVEKRRFRQDLYYRLRVIELKVPPVRDRTEDILALANYFAENIAKHIGREPVTFSPGAIRRMMSYNWPGNVRELRNSVEYALALSASNRIEQEDLPEELQAKAYPRRNSDSLALADLEREHILKVLQSTHGNKMQAAKTLGIGTATLYRKLKQYQQ